jgi:hypothetical protein
MAYCVDVSISFCQSPSVGCIFPSCSKTSMHAHTLQIWVYFVHCDKVQIPTQPPAAAVGVVLMAPVITQAEQSVPFSKFGSACFKFCLWSLYNGRISIMGNIIMVYIHFNIVSLFPHAEGSLRTYLYLIQLLLQSEPFA